MSGFIETYRGAIYPWHCDHQGHLTVMHYFGFFDNSSWQIISALGFTRSRLEAETRGFVDVTATIDYEAKQHVGGLVHIESGIKKLGNTSLTVPTDTACQQGDAIVSVSEWRL